MFWIIEIIILGIFSYLLGGIPFGFIAAKKIKGVDIRNFGSGNIGATNVGRVVGPKWGISVFILDFFKGTIPVCLVFYFLKEHPSVVLVSIFIVLLTVIGHNWPVFLNFKGGKGVATSIGAMVGLAINIPFVRLPVFISVLLWGIIFLVFRIVGIASVAAGVCFSISCFLISNVPAEIKVLSVLIAVFIIARHKKNLKEFFSKRKEKQ